MKNIKKVVAIIFVICLIASMSIVASADFVLSETAMNEIIAVVFENDLEEDKKEDPSVEYEKEFVHEGDEWIIRYDITYVDDDETIELSIEIIYSIENDYFIVIVIDDGYTTIDAYTYSEGCQEVLSY